MVPPPPHPGSSQGHRLQEGKALCRKLSNLIAYVLSVVPLALLGMGWLWCHGEERGGRADSGVAVLDAYSLGPFLRGRRSCKEELTEVN